MSMVFQKGETRLFVVHFTLLHITLLSIKFSHYKKCEDEKEGSKMTFILLTKCYGAVKKERRSSNKAIHTHKHLMEDEEKYYV